MQTKIRPNCFPIFQIPKIIKIIFLHCLVQLLFVNFYFVLYSYYGQEGAFLRLGIGSRGISLGKSFVSISDDVSGLYWNPSTTVQMKKPELMFMYFPLWEDTEFKFVGFSSPFENIGTLSGGIISLDSYKFEKRAQPWGEPEEYFSISDRAILVSYGRRLIKDLSAGVSLKYLTQSIMGKSVSSIAGDLSLFYRVKKMSMGANIQNIFSTSRKYYPYSPSVSVPMDILTGLGYFFQYRNFGCNLLLGLNYLSERKHFELSTAVEPVLFQDKLFLRFGYSDNNFRTGVGINFKDYKFDLSLVPHTLGFTYNFSLTLKFGKTKEEIEAELKKPPVKFTRSEAKKLSKLHYKKALQHFKNEEYELSIIEFDKSLLWDPENVLAEKYIRDAKARLEVLVSRKLVDTYITQAMKSYAEGDFMTSLDNWQKVLFIEPTNATAIEYIQKIKSRLTEKEIGKVAAEEKKKLNVEIERLLTQGDKYLAKGNFSEAIKEYEKVLKIAPENKDAIGKINKVKAKINETIETSLKLGIEFYKNKNYSKAIELFRQVLKLSPGHKQAAEYLNLSQKEAEAIVRLEVRKKSEKMYYRAVNLYLEGKYEESMSICNEIIKNDPAYKPVMLLVEKIKIITGQ